MLACLHLTTAAAHTGRFLGKGGLRVLLRASSRFLDAVGGEDARAGQFALAVQEQVLWCLHFVGEAGQDEFGNTEGVPMLMHTFVTCMENKEVMEAACWCIISVTHSHGAASRPFSPSSAFSSPVVRLSVVSLSLCTCARVHCLRRACCFVRASLCVLLCAYRCVRACVCVLLCVCCFVVCCCVRAAVFVLPRACCSVCVCVVLCVCLPLCVCACNAQMVVGTDSFSSLLPCWWGQ